jgi:hypothetical protein
MAAGTDADYFRSILDDPSVRSQSISLSKGSMRSSVPTAGSGIIEEGAEQRIWKREAGSNPKFSQFPVLCPQLEDQPGCTDPAPTKKHSMLASELFEDDSYS